MRHSLRSLEGEILIDHRASPGLDAEMALSVDIDPNLVAAGTWFEAPVFTCSHCQATVIINPDRSRPRDVCQKCGGKYICEECAAVMHITLRCNNVTERLDRLKEEVECGTSPLLLTKL